MVALYTGKHKRLKPWQKSKFYISCFTAGLLHFLEELPFYQWISGEELQKKNLLIFIALCIRWSKFKIQICKSFLLRLSKKKPHTAVYCVSIKKIFLTLFSSIIYTQLIILYYVYEELKV